MYKELGSLENYTGEEIDLFPEGHFIVKVDEIIAEDSTYKLSLLLPDFRGNVDLDSLMLDCNWSNAYLLDSRAFLPTCFLKDFLKKIYLKSLKNSLI